MICCSVEQKPVKTVLLMPDFKYRERCLQVFECAVCGKISAELVQYCIRTKRYKKVKLSKRRLAKFLARCEDGSWREVEVNTGTKQRAGFVYGVNRIDKTGNIYQYSVDFNGTKTLVKQINHIPS